MQGRKIRVAITIFFFIQGSFCQSIVLTPSQANVDLNKNFTFTCTYTGYDAVQSTSWKVGDLSPAIVRNLNGTCSGLGIFVDNTKYSVNCPSDTSFAATILRVDYDDHNYMWNCYDFNRKSNDVTIFVKVPIKEVILSGPSASFLKEHSGQIIKCRTTPARPKASIRWFVHEFNSNMKYEIVANSSSHTSSMNEGIVVESTLQLYPNRSINKWMLNCEAWTDNETRTVQSQKLTLNIAYPPNKAPVIFGLKDGLSYSLIEYEVGKLSCSTHGGNPLPNLTWNCYNDKPGSITIEDNNVTSTVTWTGLRGQLSCSCMSNHSWSETIKVTTAVIDVLYPPNKPTFSISNKEVSDVIHVILNNTVHVKCASISNPRSNYSWTGPSDLIRISQILRVTINGKQNSMYKCTARNEMLRQNGTHVNGRNESSITMQVMYPPEKPNFKYELKNGTLLSAGTVIDVIAGDSFSIHCNAEGNPFPSCLWNDRSFSNGVLKLTSITSDTNKTCHAKNIMEETVGERRTGLTSALFSIRVLHPPSTPTITISNGTRQLNVTVSTIQIRETDNAKLTCFSEGKPYPNYTWTSPNNQIQRNVLNLSNISRMNSGNYTCHVNNLMYRTFEGMEPGSNSSSIFLDIMYPSVILPLKDIDILEGSNLNVTCQVKKGNPTLESIAWTRAIDTMHLERNQLIITNVSRADDTKYSCTLQSTIKPTIGDDTVIVTNRTFHLNVFFPSEIKNFTVKDSKSRGTFIVNKTVKVSLECTAEANPASNLSIINPQGNIVSTTKETNVLHYNISNASFKNAGRYICEGRNNYTKSKSSVSDLIMIVKCPPRPSPFIAFDKKVAASQYTNTTLRFVAHEYLDEHNKTEFIWFKQKTQLAPKRNDVKFEIHTIGLDSSLTIRNITQPDFGEYSVKVLNTIGEYIHHYVLQAEDKPDVPINFTYIPGTTTDSSVTLIWKPGFDGGFQQTFVLLYKFGKAEKWDSVQVKDTNDKTMNYTLSGLLSSKVYDMKMFAKNQLGNSSTTRVLQITTEVKVTAFDSQSSDKAGILAGSISGVAIFIIVSIIFAVYFLKKRHNKETDRLYQNVPFIGSNKKQSKTETKHEKETTFQDLQEVDDVPNIMYERTEYSNSPEIIEQLDRIEVSELYAYVRGRMDSLEVEYQQKLPTGLQKPCIFARKPENIALNRYNGIYPYDHSRVKMKGNAAFFINACYIDGYKQRRRYIASLGPTSKTTNDFETFWQMIWNEKSDLIVMLTNLHEHSGMKCEQYWPKEGSWSQYGKVNVTSQTIEVFAEYTIRTFLLSKADEQRSLTHLHYTAWPDKTVPEDVSTLLEFRQRLKATPTTSEGPIVVHCSAGIGRTGTLIAIDRLIEEGLDIGSVSVLECVKSMREQRVKMVQTLEQYIYIHKALVMALSFRAEPLSVEIIREYVKTRNGSKFSMLFQQLQQTIETDSEAEQKARNKNREYLGKNRHGADIPGNRFSIYLHLNRGDEETDYINAVYVNSFKKKNHFIIAQSPLPSTVEDFLALVYQEECSCIIAMEDLNEPGMTVGKYLPEEKKTLTIGNFKVACSKLETKQTHVVRKMKIKYTGKYESGEKSIIHFQYTKWLADNDIPGHADEFVKFANEVEEYAKELGDEKSPVLVHCLKAKERSCLFCGVVILMEKLKHEHQVNVIDTLRHLRTRRQMAITSQKQFEFCYQASSAYIEMYMKVDSP